MSGRKRLPTPQVLLLNNPERQVYAIRKAYPDTQDLSRQGTDLRDSNSIRRTDTFCIQRLLIAFESKLTPIFQGEV